MKHTLLIFLFFILMGCQFEQPTQFSKEALVSELVTLNNRKTTFKEVINQYLGKKIVIDVWASWCADCIRGFPKVKQLQESYPEVVFLFLSVDKNARNWKKGITRFSLSGNHYLISKDFDAPLSEFLNLNWIPRYLIIDEKGDIALFKATKATDKNIEELLRKY